MSLSPASRRLLLRHCLYLLPLLALAASTFVCCQREQRLRNKLETMPLRDDLRKETVLELPEASGIARILDKSHLLYAADSDLILYNFRDSTVERVLSGHTGTLWALDISPDGKKAVSGASDGTIRVWDTRTGALQAVSKALDTLDQPSWTLMMDVRFTYNGKHILTADMGGVKKWRARDCRLLEDHAADLFYMRPGCVSPDGKTCCAPTLPDGFELMDLTGNVLYAKTDPCDYLCYSPEGSHLLCTDPKKGAMYNLNVTRILRKDGTFSLTPFLGDDAPMIAAVFSHDCKQLVSLAEDGSVYVWNAQTGSLRETFHTGEKDLTGVSISPDGNWILAYSGYSHRFHIWGPPHWII